MKLESFRVYKFRSVEDSGWIDTNEVTAFIGTNESGKTNLLVPLWKLNPAKGGEINPLQDYPRDQYHNIRVMKKKPIFIEAIFRLTDDLAKETSALSDFPVEQLFRVLIQRDFDGEYFISFPDIIENSEAEKGEIEKIITDAEKAIIGLAASKSEETLKEEMINTIKETKERIKGVGESVDLETLKSINSRLGEVDTTKAVKRSVIAPRFGQMIDEINDIITSLEKPTPEEIEEVNKLIMQNFPSFVYYSNYGNLDSEIYLPHVIENMNRDDLGVKESAKVRTLRVLFDFVKLSPKEILELGKDFHSRDGRKPTQEEIESIAEKKKERDILLQSASTELTNKFRDWWKQGNYKFRFQADGDHFRIWVSDDKRPEDIELEGRSTGLQWFLSFYLVFLVESQASHKGAILLLDEPGLSLHPIAQRDLSNFFENLSQTNQILYTTHSPFMVDPDQLDRVKAVYVNDEGSTAVSTNLRAREGQVAQSQSIYPVYAALGLTVSDTLLQGSKPIVVEGQSDLYYLSTIKNYLIGKGQIAPSREIIFIPAGGVRGIGAVVSILTGKDEELPYVVLDSDSSGKGLAKKLSDGIYKSDPNQVLLVSDFIDMENAEIEDLFPVDFFARIVTRFLPRPAGLEDDFSDVVKQDVPIITQIEAYTNKNEIELIKGWKVELSKLIKKRLISGRDTIEESFKYIDIWKKLFLKFQE